MNWYYAKNGAQQGPVSLEDMKSRIAMGEVSSTDLAWSEGMADWMPVGSIAEFKVEPPAPAEEKDLPASPAFAPTASASPSPEPYRTPGAAPAAQSAAYVQAPSQGMSIAALICGILSLVLCCMWFGSLPLALVAIVLGHMAISRVNSDPSRSGGKGMARAGLVTGYLGLLASIVMAFFWMQFRGLSQQEVEEKMINMMPLNEQQRQEIRDELQKKRQGTTP
jgi:hypothetical protein